MAVLSGKTRIQLGRRLGEDWEDLAVYFAIPRNRCERFTAGHECDGILVWLEERERLGELSEALQEIDRDDLIPLLEDASTTAAQTPAATWQGSPFPGLRRFNPEDAPIFFGRYRDTKGLLRKLADPANRFIAVLGASGSGKSSLVAAGLIPQLQANAIEGSKDWIWLEFTPGGAEGDPYPTLTARLEPWLKRQGLREPEIARTLRAEHGFGLIELAEKALANRPAPAELLLFIDQFEELFTLTKEAHREPFIHLLTTTARAPRVRMVVAMRADFFHRCLDYPGLDRLLRDGSYPLGPPGTSALYEMITGPATQAGLEFEEGLVERILDDTGTGPGALALMAFALHELYEARETDGRLTHRAYERFGGVQQAISKRAEDTFQSLDSAAQAALGNVFRELLQVDDRGVATRQRAPLQTLGDSPATHSLIDRFVDARLLVRGPGEDGLPVVEVAHEALFRSWTRLKDWIEKTGDDHRLRRQITQLAAYWKAHDCKDEHRWPDERVVEAVAMLDHLGLRQEEFPEVERDFLGPLDRERMLAELDDSANPHQRRAIIGVRLALLGDPRPGVGLREDGLPNIVWCAVPGGEIVLDIETEERSRIARWLKHRARDTFSVEPFYIAKYPVTYIQYRAFLEASDGFANPVWWQGLWFQVDKPGKQFNRRDNHPAENLRWLEAMAFCRWLSARLDYEIRLPTEWEWQQAATGGDWGRVYPWPGDWDASRANTYESELSRSTAVGMYPHGASPVGALDMAGNVWEWCLNEYENPRKVGLSGNANRVVRGGSWEYARGFARAASRDWFYPGYRYNFVGVRLVCASPIF
jgi:formylglycine-generating enzyme required for sulfatase activity